MKAVNVRIADRAGFCFGVERAEKIVYNTLNKFRGNIFTIGPLIHNPLVVEKLEKAGVKPVSENELEDLPENSTVIIRSHGIDKELRNRMERMDIKVIDATCPFVKNAKEAAIKLRKEGYTVLILGDRNHPEVKGIQSYIDYQGMIIKDTEELERMIEELPDRTALIAQTTQNREVFEDMIKILSGRIKEFEYKNTICNATALRQKAAIDLVKSSEAMIVIGGYNSANTKRLVEICSKICKNVIWIEKTQDLDLDRIKEFGTIGITAGASTPVWSIEETERKIKNFFERGIGNDE